MNFRMIQAMIKCFEKSTVERFEENSNDISRCQEPITWAPAAVYSYDNVIRY